MTLLVRLHGKAGRGERLSAILQPVAKDNDIAGCLGIEVFRNSVDGDDFLLLERWESVADHQAHIARVEKVGGFKEMQENVDSVTRTYHPEDQQQS
ncbi:MAG: antibiotic biosynthesis monooxygenase family protein [Gammaproteobacteria bacterium]